MNSIIHDFIGEGGMGTVYRVTNIADSNLYALKACIQHFKNPKKPTNTGF